MTVPTNPQDRPSSTPTRPVDPVTGVPVCEHGDDADACQLRHQPVTDVEHDDDGCTTCRPSRLDVPRYTHDDLMDAFQKGLLFGENSGGRTDAGYAEGFVDGHAAYVRKTYEDGEVS